MGQKAQTAHKASGTGTVRLSNHCVRTETCHTNTSWQWCSLCRTDYHDSHDTQSQRGSGTISVGQTTMTVMTHKASLVLVQSLWDRLYNDSHDTKPAWYWYNLCGTDCTMTVMTQSQPGTGTISVGQTVQWQSWHTKPAWYWSISVGQTVQWQSWHTKRAWQ